MSAFRSDEFIAPPSAGALADWLAVNHGSSDGVWVRYRRKGVAGPDDLVYPSMVLELLRFGWIDGLLRPLDSVWLSNWCCPRRVGSNWSAANVARFEGLLAAGLVEPAGLVAWERR